MITLQVVDMTTHKAEPRQIDPEAVHAIYLSDFRETIVSVRVGEGAYRRYVVKETVLETVALIINANPKAALLVAHK